VCLKRVDRENQISHCLKVFVFKKIVDLLVVLVLIAVYIVQFVVAVLVRGQKKIIVVVHFVAMFMINFVVAVDLKYCFVDLAVVVSQIRFMILQAVYALRLDYVLFLYFSLSQQLMKDIVPLVVIDFSQLIDPKEHFFEQVLFTD
jgi:hypothetical protein